MKIQGNVISGGHSAIHIIIFVVVLCVNSIDHILTTTVPCIGAFNLAVGETKHLEIRAIMRERNGFHDRDGFCHML